jgi:hypothetical protein
MTKLVEIVPATPGWYARWRFASDITQSFPVTVWALTEEATTSTRHVVGVDAGGQWPGAADNLPGADFVRYIFQAPENGPPKDVFNPVDGSTDLP